MPKFKTLSKHIAFITLYSLYEVGILYAYTGTWVNFWDMLWHLLINLSLFYFNSLVLLTRCNRISPSSKAFFYGIVLTLAEFIVFLFLKYVLALIYIQFGIKATHPYAGFNRLFLDATWRFVYIIGLSFSYWLAIVSHRKQQQVKDLEKMHLKDLAERENAEKQIIEIENAFLKSQINSHFLFNTLTFLHNSVQRISEQAGETVIYLSRIMRYSLDLPFGGKVYLKNELEHIRNLLHINKLIAQNKFYVDFHIVNDPNDLKIIPLVLITLTENLLKHGYLRDKTEPAKIICGVHGLDLIFKVSNKKRNYASPIGHGIGLINVRKRLELSYAGGYTLTEINKEDYYEIELNVRLEP